MCCCTSVFFFVILACANICRVHSPRDVENPMKSGSCIHTIALHVKRWAKLFNNIGLLSVSAKGAASAGWCSSRDLFPFTGALIPLKNTFTNSAQKDTKANDPYLSRNLLLTLHVCRIFHSNWRKIKSPHVCLEHVSQSHECSKKTYLTCTKRSQTKEANWTSASCLWPSFGQWKLMRTHGEHAACTQKN